MLSFHDFCMVGAGALASLVYGVDYGYLGGVLAEPLFIKKYGTFDASTGTYKLLSDRLSLITSAIYIGSVIGALLAPSLSSKVGKRYGLIIGCASFCLGSAIQLGAVNIGMFLCGRALSGILIAFATIMGPSYVNEVAPRHLRGFGVVLCLQLVTFGNFFSNIVTLASASRKDEIGFQIPISLCIIVGGLVGFSLLLMPETPLILAERGQMERAKASLIKLRRMDETNCELIQEWEEVKSAVHRIEPGQESRWIDLFDRDNRKRTFQCVATLVLMNGFTGINFFLTYASVFMAQAGFTSPWGITVLIAGTNCFTTLPSLWLVERMGRRSLCALGTLGMVFMNLGAGITHSIAPDSVVTKKLLVVFVTFYVFFFAAFYGPSGWAFSAEVSCQRLRSKTIAFANVCSMIFVWGVGYGSPYLFQDPVDLQASFCYIWLGGCLVAGVFNYFYLYETAGLSHGEMEELLASGVPASGSKAWGSRRIAARLSIAGETGNGIIVDEKEDKLSTAVVTTHIFER